MGVLWQDLRYGLRRLANRPGTSLLAILVLALGIGSTSAIFSIVDSVLLRSLPYRDSDRLYGVWNTYPTWRGHEILDVFWDRIPLSYPEYLDWRDHQRSFEEVAIYGLARMTLTGSGDPAQLTVGLASGSLLPLLGVQPLHGRGFLPGEDGPDAASTALLSHRLWRERFDADPGIAGSGIVLDGRAFDVVGILPRDFRLRSMGSPVTATPDVWIPVGADGAALDDYGHHTYEGIGLLAPSVPLAQAEAETVALLRGDHDPERRGARVTPRKLEEVGAATGPLTLLIASVGILTLIACGNIAILLLSETVRRRHELATRAALGAPARRILTQILTESSLLGVLGAAAGAVLAGWILRLLLRFAPADLPLPPNVGIDLRVLLVCAVLGLVTGVLSGLAPAVIASRSAPLTDLKRGPSTGNPTGWWIQRVVVAGELALSLVLIVSAGLLATSLANLLAVDPGFRTKNRITVPLQLPEHRYASDADATNLLRNVRERVAALPGVLAVTGSSAVPFSGLGGSSSFDIVGREVPEHEKKPEAVRRTVLPGYHETLGIPLLAGRLFAESDREGAPGAVLISESLAHRYWPSGSALGARIERDRQRWEVVGIVGDVLDSDLSETTRSTFYFPAYQQPTTSLMLVIETVDERMDIGASIRTAIWSVDPMLPVSEITPLAGLVSRSIAEERYRAVLLAAFALFAALLSAIGVFGVTARAVAQRAREMAIRVALGARPGALVVGEMSREARALILGIGAGLAGALAVGSLLDRFLFDVGARDATTLTVAAALLFLVGLAASYLAARRLSRLDPSVVLKAE